MPAEWLSNSSDLQGRVTGAVQRAMHSLSEPARARRLRQVLVALFALWAVLALVRLVWALFPAAPAPAQVDGAVVNPVAVSTASASSSSVDIERMMAWHLFGKAGVQQPEVVVKEPQGKAGDARDGIEQGASETRLDLKLRGVVASSKDGAGHAIIEHKKRQNIYAVDDKLPVSGRVVLAKVMPRQVVLDNGGKYELLILYEEGELDAQLPVREARQAPASAATQRIDQRARPGASALAQSYRNRLYQDPQSLAEVVSVSAVRKEGALLGYRIAPGKDRQQFEQLGFKAGDIVTSVNGIALDDPANTMRLYQTMRSASEAVFEVQREEQQLTVSVNLDSVKSGQ